MYHRLLKIRFFNMTDEDEGYSIWASSFQVTGNIVRDDDDNILATFDYPSNMWRTDIGAHYSDFTISEE